jgi:deoxyribose-phosphate aldolase
MTLSRVELAGLVDHTLLTPEATRAEVEELCREAVELGVHGVCVAPSMLPLRPGVLAPGITLVTVCGYPTGAHQSAIKAAEAGRAVTDGAVEIDVVADLGAVRAGSWSDVERDIATVRTAVPPGALLKVVLETAGLSDADIVNACLAVEAAGADYIVTSTGVHSAGGATLAQVELVARTVAGRLGVKARGGLRTTEQALAVIEAGATRVGLTATRAVLDGLVSWDQSES